MDFDRIVRTDIEASERGFAATMRFDEAAIRAMVDKVDAELFDRIAAARGYRRHDVDVAALDKRLMPEGLEWPRFEDGSKVEIYDYIVHDGNSERVQGIYFYRNSVSLSLTGVDHELLHTVRYGERAKRPEKGGTR